MSLARRAFLRFAAVAPAALPIAAKEAATKMGLSGIASAVGAVDAAAPCSSSIGVSHVGQSQQEWLQIGLDRLLSDRGKEEIANEARRTGRLLDPDLAAHRSMSPAIAYRIQVERMKRRISTDRQSYFLYEIAEDAKRSVLG